MKPTITPTIAPLPGFRAAGVHCGLKAADALDFALIVSDSEAVTAGEDDLLDHIVDQALDSHENKA